MKIGSWVALALALLPSPLLAVDLQSLMQAARAGDVGAMNNLGIVYENGSGVPIDLARARDLYQRAAQGGDTAALHNLGRMYEKGLGVSRDYAMALQLFAKAAEAGNAGAQNDIGVMYERGWGSPRNYDLALSYYRLAANQGYAPAISNLGYAYETGQGVPRDYASARQYYEQAAKAGHIHAYNNLGALYSRGLGVPRDDATAFKFFSFAAERGDPQALGNVGLAYKNGAGVALDVAKAITYLQQAASKGYAAGAFNMGLIYRDGIDGIAPNADTANGWFRMAVTLGYDKAASFIVTPRVMAAAPQDRSLTPFFPTSGGAKPATPVALTGAVVPKGPRLALVIANSDYAPNLNALKNPVHDGKLMADVLTKAGFTVTPRYNVNIIQMKQALTSFVDAVRRAGPNTTALFYYAGHGAAAEGANYLIPVGQAIDNQTALQTFGQSADDILKLLDSAKPTTTIVILDACRNVAFRGARGSSGGLTQMNARNGSIIAYSTAPGATAADGDGDDSPYSTALADIIRKSNEPLEIAFKRVRARVAQQTQSEQMPWESTSLVSDFSFQPR